MPICNNNYLCHEDMITFDEITSNNKCIAIAPNKCTMCDTIKEIQAQNSQFFNENPIKAIFNEESSNNEITKFWQLLKEICNINHTITEQKDQSYYIPIPNIKKAYQNIKIIVNRYNNQQYSKNKDKNNAGDQYFINTMLVFISILNSAIKMNKTADHFSDKNKTRDNYYRQIKNILEKYNFSSQSIHYPNELVINIEIILTNLATVTKKKFFKAIHYILSKPQICMEALLTQINNILNSNNFTQKQKKRLTKKKSRIMPFKTLNQHLNLKVRSKKNKTMFKH